MRVFEPIVYVIFDHVIVSASFNVTVTFDAAERLLLIFFNFYSSIIFPD